MIFEKLKSRPADFDVRGVVRCAPHAARCWLRCHADSTPRPVLPRFHAARRTEASKQALGGGKDVIVVDITAASSLDALKAAFQGCDALVIATSATPQMAGPPKPGERPNFVYPPGGLPEAVDWVGQKAQIDAAKACGIKQLVTIGSRGGSQPPESNMLNQIGGAGTNILVWKRKAEQYLVDSGIPFTIIRAGGLLGEDKPGGKRTLVVGADDADLGARSVPRADVAEVAVQALLCPDASRRSMDLVSKEEGDGAPTTDFAALFRACKAGM